MQVGAGKTRVAIRTIKRRGRRLGIGEAIGVDVLVGIAREFVNLQPGMRSGIAKGSELSWPMGSLRGHPAAKAETPSLACRMVPTCQPLTSHDAGPWNDDIVGSSYKTFRVKLRPTLKSERPRVIRRSPPRNGRRHVGGKIVTGETAGRGVHGLAPSKGAGYLQAMA